jgi:hypothetical protein
VFPVVSLVHLYKCPPCLTISPGAYVLIEDQLPFQENPSKIFLQNVTTVGKMFCGLFDSKTTYLCPPYSTTSPGRYCVPELYVPTSSYPFT